MVIQLSSELKAVLLESARRKGIEPEALVLETLRERFLPTRPTIEPRDEWEQHLIDVASDFGVSLPNSALSSDGIYE